MAVTDCDRRLEIDPQSVKAYIRMGNLHIVMEDYQTVSLSVKRASNLLRTAENRAKGC